MKKIKIALLLGAMFGASIQANNIDLSVYSKLSIEDRQADYLRFVIKLEEDVSLLDLSNNLTEEFILVNDLNSGYKVILFKTKNISADVLLGTGLLVTAEESNILRMTKTEDSIQYFNQENNYSTQTLSDDPLLVQQLYFNETSSVKGGSSLSRAIEEKQQNNIGRLISVGIIDSGSKNHNDVIFQGGQNFAETFGDLNRSEGHEDVTVVLEDGSADNYISCTSKEGHGIGVASIIGSLIDNNEGLAGIVSAKLFAARVSENDCNNDPEENLGFPTDITRAITWLSGLNVPLVTDISEPVDVINISMAYKEPCGAALQNSIDIALNKGIIIIASAGNTTGGGDDSSLFLPANCNGVIVVGSNDTSANKSEFSNYGEKVTLTALGENIVVANLVNGYHFLSGTSFSAPIVSGVAGLLKEKYEILNQSSVKYLLQEGATPHSNSPSSFGKDCDTSGRCGAGVLNAYNSMILADQLFGFETTVSHFYDDKDNCEGNVYLEKMSNLGIDVCNLYNVNVKEIDNFKKVKYQVIKREKAANSWTENNSIFVDEFSIGSSATEVTYKLNEKDDNYEYGIRICDMNNVCFNSQDLNFTSFNIPEFCND